MRKIQPDNRPVGQSCYLLCEKFVYEKDLYSIEVPEGFVNDGASVPRWAWSVSGLTPDGLLRAAAIVHDFHYRFGIESRAFADKMFYEMLLEYGVRPRQARLAYAAVRLGGRRHFGSIEPPRHDNPCLLKLAVKEYYEANILSDDGYLYALTMIDALTP